MRGSKFGFGGHGARRRVRATRTACKQANRAAPNKEMSRFDGDVSAGSLPPAATSTHLQRSSLSGTFSASAPSEEVPTFSAEAVWVVGECSETDHPRHHQLGETDSGI